MRVRLAKTSIWAQSANLLECGLRNATINQANKFRVRERISQSLVQSQAAGIFIGRYRSNVCVLSNNKLNSKIGSKHIGIGCTKGWA